MDPKALYQQLHHIIETMPEKLHQHATPDVCQWLGRANALVAASGDSLDKVAFQTHMDGVIGETNGFSHDRHVSAVKSILYRRLAAAELNAPAEARGAFIAAGNAFDALAAVAKVIQSAKSTALIVDPYLDEKVLTDFVPLADGQVSIRLLADERGVKPSLRPAVARWALQYPQTRPLAARLTAAGALHDRLIIIDDFDVWVLTQSFNALAARSPASIVRVENDAAQLKKTAYDSLWQNAVPVG